VPPLILHYWALGVRHALRTRVTLREPWERFAYRAEGAGLAYDASFTVDPTPQGCHVTCTVVLGDTPPGRPRSTPCGCAGCSPAACPATSRGWRRGWPCSRARAAGRRRRSRPERPTAVFRAARRAVALTERHPHPFRRPPFAHGRPARRPPRRRSATPALPPEVGAAPAWDAATGVPDAAAPAVPHNVPAALSSLVGRTREVAEIGRVLASSRLVTLIGPGGAGKTRLAREVAAATVGAGAHPGGVWWVELAPVGAGADVAATVAAVLGVSPPPGRPVVEALAAALGGAAGAPRRLLLVLDNCEHVIDDVAALAEQLLRAAPGLTVLATSREALAIEGEVARPVPPLARPPVGAGAPSAPVDAYEAVQLFVERARAASPGFALTEANAPAVAAICARLDGLPLALELAAAVLPALGVEALAARLDDALALLARGRRTALPRHRTLRAVLDWSHELLTGEERGAAPAALGVPRVVHPRRGRGGVRAVRRHA
jgi:hypothetical protein